MPVTGEFLADFNNFIVGAEKADKALTTLEKSGVSMGTALDRTFKDFDIERLFTHPVETATGLAQDFAGKIGTVGTVAIGATAAVGALATGAIALANSFADAAAHLGDLHDQTGISVSELSKLATAATLAGTTLDAIALASLTMQQRMANNPQEFIRGLETLNLNAKDFIALNVDQQFEAFARAMAAADDPQQRIIAGQDIIGKQVRELIPALVNLGATAIDAADGLGHVVTTEDVANANAYRLQVGELKAGLGGMASDVGSVVVPALLGLGAMFKDLVGDPVKAKWAEGKQALRDWGAVIDAIGGNARAAAPPIDEMAAATVRFGNAAADAAKKAKELADQTAKDRARQDKEYADWLAQQAQFNKERKDADKKAADDRAADDQKRLNERLKAERDASITLQGLWRDYYATATALSGDATDQQIAQIVARANAEAAALDAGSATYQESVNVIIATASRATENVLAQTRAQDKGTRDYYQAMATNAEAAYQRALAAGAAYTPARLAQLKAESDAAAETLKHWQAVAEAALTDVGNAADDTAGALAKTAAAVDTVANKARAAFMPGEYSAPSSGLHQETRFGSPVLVNDAGQVVQANLQAQYGASGFLGYGLPQGQTMQNVINMNGILMGNDPAARQQLADAVSSALTSTLKNQGVRLGNA